MKDAIKVRYQDVEILYVEGSNQWQFELRGRERRCDSLTKAKEAIDARAPKDKKPFTRIKAYKTEYGDRFVIVEVTSIAETHWGSQEVWISSNGSRSKQRADSLYEYSESNAEAVGKIVGLKQEVERLNKQAAGIQEQMTLFKIPKDAE